MKLGPQPVVHVPTLPELYQMKPRLAVVIAWTAGKADGTGQTPTHYRATPEGQALIYERMATNAAAARKELQA